MSVEVEPLEDPERWNGIVERSPQGTPFHRAESLDVLAEYAGMTAHRIAGFVGQEPVGLFPLFTRRKGPVSAAFSPPPDLKLPYLGPVLTNMAKLKRRKRDRRHSDFIEAALDWLDDHHDPQYVNVRTVPGYDDVRPFDWSGYGVVPRYTYVVDLETPPETLIERFSSDARSNIRSVDDGDYEIYEGGDEEIRRIVEHARERHAEQDEAFPVTPAFVQALRSALPDGAVRPYACMVDGEFAGGRVNIEGEDRLYAYVGGATPDVDVPVNDLLDWQFCVDGHDRGIAAYDLVGANNQRLCAYKAKYTPDLVPYYRVQRGTRGMTALSKLYKRLRG